MTPPRRSRSRRAAVLALAASLVMATAACTGGTPTSATSSSTPSARPVTSDESNRLAVARFNVWDHQWVQLDLRVPVQGDVLHLAGRADMREHVAYAHVTSSEGDALLQWDLDAKAVTPTSSEGLPTPAPSDGWKVAGLGTADPLDAALLLTLNLASDRPENPVLLQQNGAQHVGTGTVDGTAVDVFTAPGSDGAGNDARIRYAVDADGLLRQVTADNGAREPLVVTLTPSADRTPISLVAPLR